MGIDRRGSFWYIDWIIAPFSLSLSVQGMEAGQSLRALPLHPEGLALIAWLLEFPCQACPNPGFVDCSKDVLWRVVSLFSFLKHVLEHGA